MAAPDLETMLRLTDDAKDDWEYVVGWIDAFARGKNLGRGLLHFARHLEDGEDTEPGAQLSTAAQDLPSNLFGIVPKGQMWRMLKPFTNRPGMRAINLAKYLSGSTIGDNATYRQSLAGFSFLLDYVPNWKKVYEPGGLIQHQSFVPRDRAEEVFRNQLEVCHEHGMPSFLAVLKRHRPDPFLLSHAVDGFSLALDFPVSPPPTRTTCGPWSASWRARWWMRAAGSIRPRTRPCRPSSTARPSATDSSKPFAAIKAELDPGHMLRTGLADRLLYGT